MKYTIEDLKNRKVILENDNDEKTKRILEKAFNFKFRKNELPGNKHYVSDTNYDNEVCGFDDGDLNDKFCWNLHADGIRRLPSYLRGYKTMCEYHKCDNIPKQKASKF